MANILGVGTEDVSGISALKETVKNLENNVSIAQSAVEDLEGIVNSVEVTALRRKKLPPTQNNWRLRRILKWVEVLRVL